MSSANSLERIGKLNDFPAAELLYQATSAGLSGTFRFEQSPQKIAIYLDRGEIIYAASNLRGHRLAVKLAQWSALSAQEFAEHQSLPDFELAAKLLTIGKLTADALKIYQTKLTAEIVSLALNWTTGDWAFSPLVRVRDDLRFSVDSPALLIEAARKLSIEFVASRIGRNLLDSFAPISNPVFTFNLLPEEAFVLSRIESAVSYADLSATVGLPDVKTQPAVYALWLGGLLQRSNYQAAFDDETIRQISAAHLRVSQPGKASQPVVVQASLSVSPVEGAETPEVVQETLMATALLINEPVETSEADQQRALEEYLARLESASTYYQILDLSNSAAPSEVKQSYFGLAKRFHPDKFHSVIGSETHARLQSAFSRLAHAYETLKDAKSRELYDFKLRKEGASALQANEPVLQTPEQFFENGVAALNKGDFNEAIAYLSRAVQLAPQLALYHARLGQALASNPKFRHQSESEFNTAIRLDEKNAEWRLLLAEFYIINGMNRRAESELNRLLSQHPNHAVAREMLSTLR